MLHTELGFVSLCSDTTFKYFLKKGGYKKLDLGDYFPKNGD